MSMLYKRYPYPENLYYEISRQLTTPCNLPYTDEIGNNLINNLHRTINPLSKKILELRYRYHKTDTEIVSTLGYKLSSRAVSGILNGIIDLLVNYHETRGNLFINIEDYKNEILRRIQNNQFSKILITELDLGLGNRMISSFKKLNINTLEDLLQCSAHDLLDIYGFGQKSLDKVNARLSELGLHLRNLEGVYSNKKE